MVHKTISRGIKRATKKVSSSASGGLRNLRKAGRDAETGIRTAAKSFEGVTKQVGRDIDPGKAAGKVLGKIGPEIPEIPEPLSVADPTPMPIPDEELTRTARRRSRAKRKGGRSSSILTGGETLG